MTKAMEELTRQYLPTRFLVGLAAAFTALKWFTEWGSNQIYGALANAVDYISAAHTDNDFFFCLFLCLVKGAAVETGKSVPTYVRDMDPAHYFAFPEFGVAVAIRPGDVLLFNPKYYHCCSKKNPVFNGKRVHCTSWYLKTKVVGGNDRNAEISETAAAMKEQYHEFYEIVMEKLSRKSDDDASTSTASNKKKKT